MSTTPPRARRSTPYLPFPNACTISKMATLPCDAVIPDLGDAVAPEENGLARKQALAPDEGGIFGPRREGVVRGLEELAWAAHVVQAFSDTEAARRGRSAWTGA